MWSGILGINGMIFKKEWLLTRMDCHNQRLMPMLLCPQGTSDILRAFDYTAALIIDAEDRGHHTAAGDRFQSRCCLLLVADTSSGSACTRGKTGSEF